MPHSHHSHSGQFCKHAVGTLEEVVNEAIRQHFTVYGLTEHVPRYRQQDLYPEEAGLTPNDLSTQFNAFLDEAHRLKPLFGSQIRLLVGLETEHISPVDLDAIAHLLQQHSGRIDYIVGSVHHVLETPIDFDEATYHEAELKAGSVSALLVAYFEAQYEILDRFRPEVIGHFDLCRLYTPSLRFSDFPEAFELAKRNILFAIEYGALFEVNAAALRKGWETPYPGPDILEFIVAHGGRLALSDDSHGPHAVGLNYGRLPDYLHRAGVQDLWTLAPSDAPNPGGRMVIPVKLDGDWKKHAFWTQLGL
ncbi:Histidinol-phosphatase [Mycena indigotica]|uniref:Histidinol-phosphatase n=1 Tax=Mycena indigotica TaxID=2126181 RepID=A0A8H6SNA6_9AGAR|nr:Histidinol-phosphatase [Mycena indigotica]KAF7302168.1 Histidinol-phosphatase [Mycena indigotica]